MMKKLITLLNASVILLMLVICFAWQNTYALGDKGYVLLKPVTGSFSLVASGKASPLWVSENDFPGVARAAKDLQHDIASVTHVEPALINGEVKDKKEVVLIGTIGKSELIDRLIKNNKLHVDGIAGKWETYLIQEVEHPTPGIDRALVIAGSDKRGTIYGVYDVSEQIGVSPWYWWADVPVKKHADLYIAAGRHTDGEPAVKYRGIFINDEAPAFSGWTREKFGGVNHLAYEKIFELILRLKGNYMWPAMWGNAFNDDDPLNRKTADLYGVVMGTSHHEPMDRAQQEWKRYGKGEWNYESNGEVLRDFWRKGIENMGNSETLVTIGMRGDGDKPMTEGSNIALLEKIVADQRKIIADVTGKDASQTPQMWALYKEVQDYYDKGMRVPDDVTLLLCDDNWGNIRKLPKLTEKPRKGGYGIYYHFDYVGGPRNYKWLNTNQISKTWEQMHLAYEYNAKQVWIVNVGDLKPMEFPISFFLDYAWAPNKWPASRLNEYVQLWAEQQFGKEHAAAIADMLTAYTTYNARRKPELLDQHTYSLTNYREFERIAVDYDALRHKAQLLNEQMPAQYKDAYYELVLHPIEACANLNDLYLAAAKNKLYASQGRAAANAMADSVKAFFDRDAQISDYYNHKLAGGKWDHMMDQTHIGYVYWQEPRTNRMPTVTQANLADKAEMGVAVEGSELWWPDAQTEATLPVFTPDGEQQHFIDIFNRGKIPFTYRVTLKAPWLKVTQTNSNVNEQQRVWLKVNWQQVPEGIHTTVVEVTGSTGLKVPVKVVVDNRRLSHATGFDEGDGYVSIEAAHFTKALNGEGVKWTVIPNYGRTLSGVTTMPVTAASVVPGGNTSLLEYRFNVTDTGMVKVSAYISPTIDFTGGKGLHYAVSIDNEKPQVLNLWPGAAEAGWNKAVADNILRLFSTHHIDKAGSHTLKFWYVDPGVVLQKLVIDCGGVKPSYLGPPESRMERAK